MAFILEWDLIYIDRCWRERSRCELSYSIRVFTFAFRSAGFNLYGVIYDIIFCFFFPCRRGIHYQSTGSLHSDSQSSSSVSPIPMSPAPSPTRPTTGNCLKPPTPIPSTNLYNSKKWSSTGDFNNVAYTNVAPSTPTNRLVCVLYQCGACAYKLWCM